MEMTPLRTVESFGRDDDKWAAVVHRDVRADGVFFYSVRTTGVFCRPSCAARLARRENVRFHKTTTDAEIAGFRPCRRCRPTERPLAARRAEAIAKACRLIEEAEESPDFDAVAASVGMSRFHFQRVFRAVTGLTPKAYALAHRANRVREQLKRSATVTDAIYEAGFNSNGRFYATSDGMLGMKPTDFREGGSNTEIRFAIGETSMGSVLVAASGKGVCAILFGEDPGALAEDLQGRFPNARLTGGDGSFETWVARVVGFVEKRLAWGWTCLSTSAAPFFSAASGRLRQEIPDRIDRELLGSREEGRRSAQRSSGGPGLRREPPGRGHTVPPRGAKRRRLSGYRWGVERKRTLLEREGATAQPVA